MRVSTGQTYAGKSLERPNIRKYVVHVTTASLRQARATVLLLLLQTLVSDCCLSFC